MFTAKVKNEAGEELVLTGREDEYQIIRIEGLNPPEAQVNLVPLVAMDGARYNSARLETREIVITIRLNGEVETNRLRLYRYFRTKGKVTFFYANDTLDVSIEGYVSAFEIDHFSAGETAQITILCPYPYFSALDAIIADNSRSVAKFIFPFSIQIRRPEIISQLADGQGEIAIANETDTEAGFLLTVTVDIDCSEIVVKNLSTGEGFTLRGEFYSGDAVMISTLRGQKKISIVRGGEILNGFYTLADGSVFWQIVPGENIIQYAIDGTASSVNARLLFEYKSLYRGV